jgi:membrane dipeptidase
VTGAGFEARAGHLAHDLVIVDTHVDLPDRLSKKPADVSRSTNDGEFDYPRAMQGGLNAPFMSIYVPANYQKGGATEKAHSLIDIVEGLAHQSPDKFAIPQSMEEVLDHTAAGLISLPLGMENGAALEGSLSNLEVFHARGIRYITLTHSRNNDICDSSYDRSSQWRGLSPFGRELVPAMNRLGVMVDISHVSDETFFHVMELTEAPAIASHSSCRRFTPGWERNISDEMIEVLAARGGVVGINFGSAFLTEKANLVMEGMMDAHHQFMVDRGLEDGEPEADAHFDQLKEASPLPATNLTDVADHVDHIVELVGDEHVGIGSDFEGVDGELPDGLSDVGQYPNLLAELMRRGYSDESLARICGQNMLRVWSRVEQIAGHKRS